MDVPSFRVLMSFRMTSLPEIETVSLKSLASPKVMSLFPAFTFAVPFTVSAPLWVTSPPAVMFKVPLTVDSPSNKALASRSVTLTPVSFTEPVKSLAALSRVMLLFPALISVVPSTVKAALALWVTLQPIAVVIFRLPLTLDSPKFKSLALLKLTFWPVSETAPRNLLLLPSRVMLLAVTDVAPITVSPSPL